VQKPLDQVGEFHRHIGATVAETTVLLPYEPSSARVLARNLRGLCHAGAGHRGQGDDLVNRALMAVEEIAEWIEAHLAGDLKAAADAWADRCYLLFGDAVATGLGTEAVFDEVHRSNMTKAPVNPATGKAVKSDGYLAPVISLDAADRPVGRKHSASG
jgi:predicted HAD superfamily Cof-like phosphohydrolase